MTPRKDLAERLKLAREELELTQEQVARWLGIRRPAVAEIESATRAVKSEELVRLAALYGRSLTWLVEGEMGTEEKVQAALFRADDDADPALQREVAKLARRCHIVFELEKKLRSGRTGHRTSHVPQYGDTAALGDRSTALEHGKEVAYQERARLGIGDSAPLRDPWGVVEDAGIRVFSLELGKEHAIDGIFARGQEEQACVGVNVDKWVTRQVFTVVHEYGHALMDSDVTGEACATSQAWKGKGSRYANRELRANQFAAVFLVPREALLWFLDSRGKLGRGANAKAEGLTAVEMVRAQDHFGTSGDMLLWRLRNEGFVTASERRELREELDRLGTVAIARSLGYDLRRFAQPFGRAHEIALRAYAKGHLSLGVLAELFDRTKEQMRDQLRAWGIHQEFAEEDVLVGGGV